MSKDSPRPRNITCIGADYDGVFDIFNLDLHKGILPNGKKITAEEIEGRAKLIAKLKKITAGADLVVVFVFSKRQSQRLNKANAQLQGNTGGCCFTDLQMLCNENGWLFCTYLYSDLVNGVPLGLKGKAMFENASYDFDNSISRITHLFNLKLFDMYTDLFKECFADDHVQQHYLDDDSDPEKPIFPTLAAHVLNHKGDQLPPLWEVHLHRFDYLHDDKQKATCIDKKPRFSFISQPLLKARCQVIALAEEFIKAKKPLQARVRFGALTGKYNRPFQELIDAFECYKKTNCDLDDINRFLACVSKIGGSRCDLVKQLNIQIEIVHKQEKKPLLSPSKSGER